MAEPFQSLYRRYRPQTFAEVRGQDHVVLGLRNAVRDDRVAHAYLFSGPRGTGKTSTARILAKALNCTKPSDGEPCNRCDSCRSITDGSSLDVHELDAASNNGVDAMRDLVARASLATPGKWKVYIVDEVHMLSAAASNALLKTLEEPPSHVVFVLATTDPQKVLPTIKSRTQHFEFHLIESSTLEALLSDIAGDAELDLPPEGIEAAVRRGHGSARDALSALDLVAASGVVEDDARFVRELIAALAERDTGAALSSVEEAAAAGLDATRLAGELVDGLRSVFLTAVAPGSPHATTDSSTSSSVPRQAPPMGPARCVRALELVGTAIVDMREALDPRTTFEVALVRLTHPEVDDTTGALLERIERLERRVGELIAGGAASPPSKSGRRGQPSPPDPAVPSAATGSAAPASRPKQAPQGSSPSLGAFLPLGTQAASPGPGADEPAPPPPEASQSEQPAEPPEPAAVGATAAPSPAPSRDDLVTAWADHILPSLRPRARAVYAGGRWTSLEDGTAVFALENRAHVEHADPLAEEVAKAISAHFGSSVKLALVTETDPAGAEASSSPQPPPPPSDRPTSRAPAGAGPGKPRNLLQEVAVAEPEDYGADDLLPGEAAGTHDPLAWAEGRLLQAFPGAEEMP